MIYMLEFLGLLVGALSLAASPLLVRVLERFFPSFDDEGHATGHGVSGTLSNDRAEVRDEIRRMTNILEGAGPGMLPPSK